MQFKIQNKMARVGGRSYHYFKKEENPASPAQWRRFLQPERQHLVVGKVQSL